MADWDFSGDIEGLSSQVLDVTRKALGTMDRGRYVPSSDPVTIIPAPGSVQPMSWKMLQEVPEGQRTAAKFLFYTSVQLRIDKEPDTTTYKGDIYSFYGVKDFADAGNFYVYAMIKQEVVNP